MFDGLLKSKFYCKCKTDIRQTRTRIELIRKKRNATQKYLRNDVADLLKNGLDINAYGRAEGLFVEMNRSSCYEFVDQFCEHISKNVSAMDKQRECPEDCREAISSLMFAAARFADLPELRELRTLFSERYGKSLDCFINKEFAEKMKSVPSKELKLELLQEIAVESGLDWDSKALENKLFNESACNKNLAKETNDRDYNTLHNNINGSDRTRNYRVPANELKYARQFDVEPKKDLPHHDQKESTRNEERFPKEKETNEPKRHVAPAVKDIPVDTIRKPEKPDVQAPVRNSHIPPPPYIKAKVDKPNHAQDDSNSVKPAPKSVRRRNLIPQPVQETANGPETNEEERIRRMNKEKAAQGQRILRFFDDGGERDDEEKMMDKLLRHYSRKNGSSSDEKGKAVKYKTTNRVNSLPVGLANPPEASKKQHNRSSSLQTELLSGNAHVHPKLPDYDDFVARLAELRGKKAG